MSDARQIIFEELSTKFYGNKKLAGDSYMIQCPYHDDRTPSGGVNLAVDSDIPLGFYHCFGCGEKRHWNALAKDLGMEQIKGWQLNFSGNGTNYDQNKRAGRSGYLSYDDKLRKSLNTGEMIQWPVVESWRGYKGALIRKLGGLYYNDPMTDEVMLFFPVEVNRSYKGGVRAYMEKQVNGLSYLTSKGSWVKDYGLLGYEYIKNIVRKKGYTAIVLVEGPRDMLRLVDSKIPALAVLGSENITRKKIMRVLAMSSKLDTIYVMPDNDKAGTKMYKHVKEAADGMVKVKHLKLPKEKDEEGKLIKMDPDNAPKKIIRMAKKIIEQHRIKKAA